MNSTSAMSRRNFFIPDVMWDKMQAVARQSGTPVSEHVRAALADYLKKHEQPR